MKGIIIVTVAIIAIASLVITYAALSVASYWDDIEDQR